MSLVMWLVTIQGQSVDIGRLAAERLVKTAPAVQATAATLELEDPEHEATTDEALQKGRELVEAAVHRLNRLGKLRWGRAYTNVGVKSVSHVDSGGQVGIVVFGGRAVDHMLPEDYADMVQTLGRPRPELPAGVEDVNSLDLALIDALCEIEPDVSRVLQLVELALAGDEGIDWAAAFSAFEVIEHHATRKSMRGQTLGWFSASVLSRFNQTANSRIAVGIKARHQGKIYPAPSKPLSAKEAEWFLRGTTARWISWLLAAHELS